MIAEALQTHRAEIEPVLNEAIAALRKTDRELVVMRYLQGQSMRDIAQAQRVTENTLRQRLMRALHRLRKRLAKRGVTSSADAVAAVMESSVLLEGPTHVVEKVSAMILGTRVPHESSEAIAKGVIKMIRNIKLATGAGVALVCLVLLIGGFEGFKTAFAGETSSAAPTTAPARSEIANTPTQALRAAYRTAMSGDADGLVAACAGLTDQQAQTLKQLAPAMKAMNELEQTIAETYGVSARAQFEGSMIGMNPADLDQATEQVNGDQAIVDIGRSGPGKVLMVKVNGQWKISAATIASMPPKMAAQASGMIPLLHQMRDNVKDGKYADINEFQQAMAAASRGGGGGK
jgi:DNA-binding CsgD family transcriptional regulator